MKSIILFFCLLLLFSCENKKADPQPIENLQSFCVSFDSVSYSQNVEPIINSNCNSCHQPGTGSPFTNTYSNLKLIVDRGQLLGVITSDPSYPMMPISKSLDVCEIKIIKQWVLEGAKNN
ncbi:MAG: hypothetical protein NTX97_04120 [Bacteroidetes bacterium]|nr:hypothetical protein [Bacteroidota bacterium]